MSRVGIGVLAGAVWGIALLAAESATHHHALTTGARPWIVLLMVGAGSAAVVWAARKDRRVAMGVGIALVIGMGLGLIEGPLAETPQPELLYSIPALFSAALGSVTTWLALGAAVALAVTGRARPSAAPTEAAPVENAQP